MVWFFRLFSANDCCHQRRPCRRPRCCCPLHFLRLVYQLWKWAYACSAFSLGQGKPLLQAHHYVFHQNITAGFCSRGKPPDRRKMGRKKIQISRITDERNRQVNHFHVIVFYRIPVISPTVACFGICVSFHCPIYSKHILCHSRIGSKR